jgi:hypothetical protein
MIARAFEFVVRTGASSSSGASSGGAPGRLLGYASIVVIGGVFGRGTAFRRALALMPKLDVTPQEPMPQQPARETGYGSVAGLEKGFVASTTNITSA